MFRFVTKRELWFIEDSWWAAQLPPSVSAWHLKDIQDSVAYKYLRQFKGLAIAEAGGGDSRLLRALARHNSCYSIDPFEGMGHDPKTNAPPPPVVNLRVYLGQTGFMIRDGAFDVLFSISVVEHVPDDELEPFFADSRRILKAGDGFSLHMIDIYVAEETSPTLIERCQRISDLFFQHFNPLPGEVMGRNGDWAEALRFRCCYATNPDNVMNSWNQLVPELCEERENKQCCTLILAGWAK
jgi:hypothetical protein